MHKIYDVYLRNSFVSYERVCLLKRLPTVHPSILYADSGWQSFLLDALHAVLKGQVYFTPKTSQQGLC